MFQRRNGNKHLDSTTTSTGMTENVGVVIKTEDIEIVTTMKRNLEGVALAKKLQNTE